MWAGVFAQLELGGLREGGPCGHESFTGRSAQRCLGGNRARGKGLSKEPEWEESLADQKPQAEGIERGPRAGQSKVRRQRDLHSSTWHQKPRTSKHRNVLATL